MLQFVIGCATSLYLHVAMGKWLAVGFGCRGGGGLGWSNFQNTTLTFTSIFCNKINFLKKKSTLRDKGSLFAKEKKHPQLLEISWPVVVFLPRWAFSLRSTHTLQNHGNLRPYRAWPKISVFNAYLTSSEVKKTHCYDFMLQQYWI